MSVTSQALAAVKKPRKFRLTWPIVLGGVVALILLLSITRVVSGANDITSGGTMAAMLAAAVPIGLAGLGGLWSERSGVVNIGLEGMMILGTWFGAWGAVTWGPWMGILLGAIGGAIGAVLHAVATVTFGVDHVVSGVAINILGFGAAKYLAAAVFADLPGGGDTQSPRLPSPGTFSIPGIGEPLRSLEQTHIFFLSDLAGVLRGLTQNVSWFTLLAVLMVPLTWWVLWRTAFGLRLRSCGESPTAAESLGVNVYYYKYVAVIVSGVMAGLGGAFLSLVAAGIYREGQTGGRGYIGLATLIFGNYRPGGLAGGALLFGYTDSLQLRQGGTSVHALLFTLSLLVVGAAVYLLVKRHRNVPALITAVAGVLVFWLYQVTDSVPEQFTTATPYIVTLLVLALASQRLRPPAADGLPYRRGQGH
ncbi:ABC transporter permease [Nonomuraea sp. NPDC050310]|uniref:ABC transporter permease n=1 Tax=Nonomuraea sp. NPDC050310 TaxID=3154935 RepID=UPI0033F3A893